MEALTSAQLERAEMESVLHSGLFEKAPRLGKFLGYICERYFDGEADSIKEYSIAVEALGRSADFDPRKDSIVRVEAHRLRKRLDDYYRTGGADHSIRILIPNGQYKPHFVCRELRERLEPVIKTPATGLAVVNELAAEPVLHSTPALEATAQRPNWPLFVSLVLFAGLCGVFVVRTFSTRASSAAKPDEVWNGSAADPVPAEFRMLTGYHGTPVVDRQGHTWVADAYYSGGTSFPIPGETFIAGQPDPHLLKAQRSGRFHYDIPVAAGTHELHLYFAETEYGAGNPRGGGDSTRVFNVSVNGTLVLREFDPLAEAGGPNRLHERVLKDVVPGSDGKIHLAFTPMTLPALLNAIEIVPSTAGHIRPVRIVTQNTPVTDSDGRVWAADEYFTGGTQVFRRQVLFERPDRALYQGERYGNFSYRIPVAPGKYKLTLHFAETWFGTPNSQYAPLDSRIFDLYANGTALLRNFEVGREAGGPNRTVEKVFENLQPNAQGVILLEFVPVRNYAEVNAIEVVETD
ncbi:MAG: hypothetical protein JO061_08775 [Acidobacteriaceae bacterium]|nr:hypothetical protein [Acidobacteriaceae bacterium]